MTSIHERIISINFNVLTLDSGWYGGRSINQKPSMAYNKIYQWQFFSGHFGSWSFWWYLKWISWSWPWWYKWSVYIKILFETFKHWTSIWCPFGCWFLFGRLLRYRHSNSFIRYVQIGMFIFLIYIPFSIIIHSFSCAYFFSSYLLYCQILQEKKLRSTNPRTLKSGYV